MKTPHRTKSAPAAAVLPELPTIGQQLALARSIVTQRAYARAALADLIALADRPLGQLNALLLSLWPHRDTQFPTLLAGSESDEGTVRAIIGQRVLEWDWYLKVLDWIESDD